MATPLRLESFVWALGALCNLNRIPFDAKLLLQHFPPPYDLAQLQQAMHTYGFKAAVQTLAVKELHPASLPVFAILEPKAEATNFAQASPSLNTLTPEDANPESLHAQTPQDAAPTHRLGLILQANTERVLLLEQGETQPKTLSLPEFNAISTGEVLFATLQAPALNEDGRVSSSVKNTTSTPTATKPAFGFKWFIPELLKHKKIWREILYASFAIQLVALVTPLCTQVIIDKVVVHHTTSTLIVIAVALGLFLIFNAAMGWVRQYLVLHTGNRMDAVLGHQVFSQLFRIPLRYFEHRPTGTVVARLHGVETIREFLAGSLITLVLDCPFLIVFLAIMFWYSWQLTLIALASLALITMLSIIVTPILRKKLNHQFLLGARNQAFVTEYVTGMETVKSLQLEPQLEKKYGEYLATYLASTFESKQLSNTYNTVANTLDQLQTTAILCTGA